MARVPSGLPRSLLQALLILPLAAAPVRGESHPSEKPQIQLDRLLKLPTGLDYGVERRGGATRGEWRVRFESLEDALEQERSGLAAAREELGKLAGGADAWQVGPPIPGGAANPGEAPLDFRLRQTIRRHRDEIERLERALRDLEVEANLAAVPEAWRSKRQTRAQRAKGERSPEN